VDETMRPGGAPTSSPQLTKVGVVRELMEGVKVRTGAQGDVFWEGRRPWAAVVEEMCDVLPSRRVLAAVDHAFGVIPLLSLFENSSAAIEAARSGRVLASLGVFTANPGFSVGPSLTGHELADGWVQLTGRMDLGMPEAVTTLLLVSVNDETRLCLLPHDLLGITVPAGGSHKHGRWLDLDQVVIGEDSLSGPLTMARRGPFEGVVDAYAGPASFAAGFCSSRLLRVLRLGMGEPAPGGAPFSTSQLAAHDITRLEIESQLLLSALSRCGAAKPGSVTLLAASAKLLHRVIVTADEWAVGLGLGPTLEAHGFHVPLTSQMPLARSWMAEGELAHRMGLL
jgi:hypothetical protein